MENVKENMTEKELKELARIKRNEYARKWRSENKERVRKHQRDYWERKVLEDIEEGS